VCEGTGLRAECLAVCVVRRLRHRSSDKVTAGEEARLQGLIEAAEGDLKAHFERFAELVEEERRKREDRRAEGEGEEGTEAPDA
jgi:hypothetical protein